MSNRKELFNWVVSFHYEPDLVSVRYEVVTEELDCWIIEFTTGDTITVYGYSDEWFDLRWGSNVEDHNPGQHLHNHDSMVHRVKGIIRVVATTQKVYWI
jgi:hypothetical protein